MCGIFQISKIRRKKVKDNTSRAFLTHFNMEFNDDLPSSLKKRWNASSFSVPVDHFKLYRCFISCQAETWSVKRANEDIAFMMCIRLSPCICRRLCCCAFLLSPLLDNKI